MKCNYKNQYIKLGLLSIVLALFGQLSLVQVKAAVDTLGADEALGKSMLPKYLWSNAIG